MRGPLSAARGPASLGLAGATRACVPCGLAFKLGFKNWSNPRGSGLGSEEASPSQSDKVVK